MSSDTKRICALDIGGTKIASALVTLSPNAKPQVEAYDKIPTEADKGGAVVLSNALRAARRIFELVGNEINGIGVSSAGVIDPKTGDVTYANDLMPGWGGTHLGDELTHAFGVESRIMNDVHAHALGEARCGAGRTANSCLVVAVGTGIGGAFINQGTILLGEHNEAGHIGHVTCSDAEGEQCSCGAQGHLEPIAAGPGIINRFLELGGARFVHEGDVLNGELIDRLARAGNAAAIAAETRSGHAIGEVLGSMCNMFDPSCIILSGSVAQCGPAWHDALMRGWNQSVMPPVRDTPIVTGELGDKAPLIGAAHNVLQSAYR